LLALRDRVDVHAFAHVTGGGIPGNLARVLPDDCDAHMTRDTWPVPPIFHEVQRAGSVSDDEMAHVFNLGLGMLAVVPRDQAEGALDVVHGANLGAFVVGEIRSGRGRVTLERH
jgi:phosphoribosylformylglycinamidine cyclo-ligase